ncbi:Oidioi.mRNA.OKI2018_I69.XSR.g17020.t1.cds [Oikopleura dioica]|uniref:Oidioi.mRNA.OKI2018_I69.XSR.g17020.t1.cds n=1 Tax=Oikopleura dioica TaxID=34765 RepID=A0ABN7SQ76_OIKDI|nr:Oidioi.mRNA.OKI2018_I69.XSR.g17020.t1.cds [Oikopleura dioica]
MKGFNENIEDKSHESINFPDCQERADIFDRPNDSYDGLRAVRVLSRERSTSVSELALGETVSNSISTSVVTSNTNVSREREFDFNVNQFECERKFLDLDSGRIVGGALASGASTIEPNKGNEGDFINFEQLSRNSAHNAFENSSSSSNRSKTNHNIPGNNLFAPITNIGASEPVSLALNNPFSLQLDCDKKEILIMRKDYNLRIPSIYRKNRFHESELHLHTHYENSAADFTLPLQKLERAFIGDALRHRYVFKNSAMDFKQHIKSPVNVKLTSAQWSRCARRVAKNITGASLFYPYRDNWESTSAADTKLYSKIFSSDDSGDDYQLRFLDIPALTQNMSFEESSSCLALLESYCSLLNPHFIRRTMTEKNVDGTSRKVQKLRVITTNVQFLSPVEDHCSTDGCNQFISNILRLDELVNEAGDYQNDPGFIEYNAVDITMEYYSLWEFIAGKLYLNAGKRNDAAAEVDEINRNVNEPFNDLYEDIQVTQRARDILESRRGPIETTYADPCSYKLNDRLYYDPYGEQRFMKYNYEASRYSVKPYRLAETDLFAYTALIGVLIQAVVPYYIPSQLMSGNQSSQLANLFVDDVDCDVNAENNYTRKMKSDWRAGLKAIKRPKLVNEEMLKLEKCFCTDARNSCYSKMFQLDIFKYEVIRDHCPNCHIGYLITLAKNFHDQTDREHSKLRRIYSQPVDASIQDPPKIKTKRHALRLSLYSHIKFVQDLFSRSQSLYHSYVTKCYSVGLASLPTKSSCFQNLVGCNGYAKIDDGQLPTLCSRCLSGLNSTQNRMATILKWREPVHNAVIRKRQLQFNTLISENAEFDEIFIHDVVAKKNQRQKRKQTWETEGSEKIESNFPSAAKKSNREIKTASDKPSTSNGGNFAEKVATSGQQSPCSTTRRTTTEFYDSRSASRTGERKHTFSDDIGRQRLSPDTTPQPTVGRSGVAPSYATKSNDGRRSSFAAESDMGTTCSNTTSFAPHSVFREITTNSRIESGRFTRTMASQKESVNEPGGILSELLPQGDSRRNNVQRVNAPGTNFESVLRESSGSGTFSSFRRSLEKQPNQFPVVLPDNFSTGRDKTSSNNELGSCSYSSKTTLKLTMPECSMPENNRGAPQILPIGNRESALLQGRTLTTSSTDFLQPFQPTTNTQTGLRFARTLGIEHNERRPPTATPTYYRISNERNPIIRTASQEAPHGSLVNSHIDSPKPPSSLPSYNTAVYNRKRSEATMEIDSLVDEFKATDHIYHRQSSSSSFHSDTTHSTENKQPTEVDNETDEILNLFV